MAGLRRVQGTPEVRVSSPPPAQTSTHTTSTASSPSDVLPRAVVIRRSKGKRPLRGQYRPKGGKSSCLSVDPHVYNPNDFSTCPEFQPYQSALGGVGSRPAPSEGPQHSASGAGRAFQPQASPRPGLGDPAAKVSRSCFHSQPAAQASSSKVPPSGRPFCPPPSEVLSGSGSEDYRDYSGDDAEACSFADVRDLADPAQEDTPTSFGDALLMLQDVSPSLFCQLETTPARPMSATGAAILGSASSAPVQASALVESSTVTAAVCDALAMVRGSSAPAPGSQQEYPGGYRCGKFIRPSPLPRGPKPCSKQLISRTAVPDSALPTSPDDALVSSPGPHPVSLPDKVAADNEEFVRRALDSLTLLDSFVGGLVTAVKDPDQPVFQVSPHADGRTVLAFAEAIDSTLRFTARSLARLHLNQVLARRDALLSSSQVVSSPQTRTSLRLAPLSSSSLFDGRVQQVLHHQAEAQRDLAFSCPPRRPSAPQPRKRPGFPPPSGPRQKAPRTSVSQRSYAAPRSSAQRFPRSSNRKQPFRRPPPSLPGAAGRAHPQ